MADYTTPQIRTGKAPNKEDIPKGSTIKKELAKNIWYIEYRYKGKQIRIKEGINRIYDYDEKMAQAELILQSTINDLASGFNPINPLPYFENLAKVQMTLELAIKKFIAYHTKFNSRAKTIQSYNSKLKHLSEYLKTIQLSDVTTRKLEEYVHFKINDKTVTKVINHRGKEVDRVAVQWSAKTVKACTGYFRAFFNWCIEEEYITINPMAKYSHSKIKSVKETPDKHVPFSDKDVKNIMEYLDANDKYTAFFCRMINSTCIRPGEIVNLKVKNIDLVKKKITIPATVKKNTKSSEADILDIEPNFIPQLENLNLENYPADYYLTGDVNTIVGENPIGNNKPYKRFVKALEALSLTGKGYDLYSFKHYSNIKRINAGWTMAMVMKANRHSSLEMTQIYLRKLSDHTEIKNLAVPTI
jgi:integrase